MLEQTAEQQVLVLMAVVAQSSLGKHAWELLVAKSLVDSSIPSKQTNMCQGV